MRVAAKGKYFNSKWDVPVWSTNTFFVVVVVRNKGSSFFFFSAGMQRTDIFRAAASGNIEGVRAELCAGVDPNQFSSGQTALMLACEKGHSAICELLLRNGAKVNAVDTYNRTALYQAVVFNHIECARVLLQFGASLDICSWLGGEGPQDIAKLRSNVGMQRIFQQPSTTTITQQQQVAVAAQTSNNVVPSASPSLDREQEVHVTPLAMSRPRAAPAPEYDETSRREVLSSNPL